MTLSGTVPPASGMHVVHTALPGVFRLCPVRHGDGRGYFSEIFRSDVFEAHAGTTVFVQDNMSLSREAGTVRGLHFQAPPFSQGKLVRCLDGAILDVAVDLRNGSPSYGQHVAVELEAERGDWLWIPAGFAHGLCTLRPGTRVLYKVTAPYSAAHDRGLAWDDPDLAIVWPVSASAAVLSQKDRRQPRLRDLPPIFAAQPAGGA